MANREKRDKSKVTKSVKRLDLFKVTISLDIMAMAYDQEEASKIAKIQLANEIEYLKYESSLVSKVSSIPDNWKDVIPYYPEGEVVNTQNCAELVVAFEPVKPEPVKPEPVKPEPVKPEPVKPEPVKPEPVKPEPVKPMPILNFNIPPRKSRK